jgi:hypothetical protein
MPAACRSGISPKTKVSKTSEIRCMGRGREIRGFCFAIEYISLLLSQIGLSRLFS